MTHKEYCKAYYRKHGPRTKKTLTPEGIKRRRATARAWRERNRNKIRDYKLRFRSSMTEAQKIQYKRTGKRWYAANPDRVKAMMDRQIASGQRYIQERANNARRRAKRVGQLHPLHDKKAEADMFRLCRCLSNETGVAHELDHIIPLAAGGWHHHLNLQILPEQLNNKKRANPFWIWPGYKSWMDVPSWLWPEQIKDKYNESYMQSHLARLQARQTPPPR